MRVRGVPLELHASPDYVSDHIRRTGDFYEAAILDELRVVIRGGVLVDAGAMIGNHTAFLAAFVPHDSIHAFEPAPVNLTLLERNVARFPTVTVHPVALSDKAGLVEMTVLTDNRGHGVIRETDPYPDDLPALTVETRTLDSYDLRGVSLLKVDVEWHEPQALAGARQTIQRDRPLIVIEDWAHKYAPMMATFGYRLRLSWEREHQTFLYEPI